jgi:hypothetical protein
MGLFVKLVLCSVLHSVSSYVAKSHGGGSCSSDDDCQLNGRCQKSECVCDEAWTGNHCAYLNSQPSAGSAYRLHNSSSWVSGRVLLPVAL